jgi:hypothetical protein
MKTTDWNFRGWDGSLKRLAWCFLDRQCRRVLLRHSQCFADASGLPQQDRRVASKAAGSPGATETSKSESGAALRLGLE